MAFGSLAGEVNLLLVEQALDKMSNIKDLKYGLLVEREKLEGLLMHNTDCSQQSMKYYQYLLQESWKIGARDAGCTLKITQDG